MGRVPFWKLIVAVFSGSRFLKLRFVQFSSPRSLEVMIISCPGRRVMYFVTASLAGVMEPHTFMLAMFESFMK